MKEKPDMTIAADQCRALIELAVALGVVHHLEETDLVQALRLTQPVIDPNVASQGLAAWLLHNRGTRALSPAISGLEAQGCDHPDLAIANYLCHPKQPVALFELAVEAYRDLAANTPGWSAAVPVGCLPPHPDELSADLIRALDASRFTRTVRVAHSRSPLAVRRSFFVGLNKVWNGRKPVRVISRWWETHLDMPSTPVDVPSTPAAPSGARPTGEEVAAVDAILRTFLDPQTAQEGRKLLGASLGASAPIARLVITDRLLQVLAAPAGTLRELAGALANHERDHGSPAVGRAISSRLHGLTAQGVP